MLKLGNKAPLFSLPDQEGKIHDLADSKGQWVLLYFYPKDDTPGCTKEACMIRDSWPEFKKLPVQVFGVSVDSVKKHAKFVEKYELPFILLADEEKDVVKKYEVWGEKKFMGRVYQGINRVSYLIDPEGNIAKIYENVKPAEHAQQVLEDLTSLI
jgi:peroxiredoxin Q/BCP